MSQEHLVSLREKLSQKTVPWLKLTFNSWSWILLTQPDGNRMAELTPTIRNNCLTKHSLLLSQVLKGLTPVASSGLGEQPGWQWVLHWHWRESCATRVDVVQPWISRMYLCNVLQHYFSHLWCWLQPLLMLFTNSPSVLHQKVQVLKTAQVQQIFFYRNQPFRYHIFLFNSAVERKNRTSGTESKKIWQSKCFFWLVIKCKNKIPIPCA